MADTNEPGEITRLLHNWRDGDPAAFDRLIPVVYEQLHAIAIGVMRRERTDHTLQPTALLNELYVKLVSQRRITWDDREHFYTFTARLMRNILIDHARSRMAQRRGGPDQVKLEKLDARKAQLVELRFFLSFTTEETAEILKISRATAERDLKFVRSWLYRELKGEAALGA